MAFTAYQSNSNALYQAVNQNAHGFDNGDVVTFNGANWVLAQSDAVANCGLVHIVSFRINANSFYVTQAGYVSGLVETPINPATAFIPGTTYYLSETTAGKLTATPPTGLNQVLLPCFKAYSATSGFFFGNDGTIIGSSATFDWNTVINNTVMSPNAGYWVDGAIPLEMTLPPLSATKSIIKIQDIGGNGTIIKQNAGQSVTYLDKVTTVGVGGSITLAATGGVLKGSFEMICTTANTNWDILWGSGNWTFA